MRALLSACAIMGLFAVSGEQPVDAQDFGAPLPDSELATLTGKFMLPGGGSLALSVTSDTLVNGTPVLRTVLTIDQTANLQVFGRDGNAASAAATGKSGSGSDAGTSAGAGALASGVSVLFDRRTGAQITVPTVSTVRTGTVGAADSQPGLVPLAIVAGGPAVQTPDGLVTLTSLANGSQVTLAGDQIGIAHLVGQSVATAVLNAGNDRTIDTVTTIGVTLHDATALTMGSAALKMDVLAADVARGLVR
ncbi:hypothetical protein [Sphingomonas sp. MA1305]|uniref:hypothetical protein n=1 Tax=Sphingomonas sp. MA1305 TaxID=2479204 RepID=UPI0018E01800|nr:hypothetical protein [Sphingomonas sp. MA1305]